jgi:thiamine-monophosphate kinase
LTTEPQFIAMMRAIATAPSARRLNDDAAVIAVGTETLIITHDMMVESVHWLPDANPADVAWKLVV